MPPPLKCDGFCLHTCSPAIAQIRIGAFEREGGQYEVRPPSSLLHEGQLCGRSR